MSKSYWTSIVIKQDHCQIIRMVWNYLQCIHLLRLYLLLVESLPHLPDVEVDVTKKKLLWWEGLVIQDKLWQKLTLQWKIMIISNLVIDFSLLWVRQNLICLIQAHYNQMIERKPCTNQNSIVVQKATHVRDFLELVSSVGVLVRVEPELEWISYGWFNKTKRSNRIIFIFQERQYFLNKNGSLVKVSIVYSSFNGFVALCL